MLAQVPVDVQVDGLTMVLEPLHELEAHTVPSLVPQAPAPSQLPVVWQKPAPWGEHSLSGSVPLTMLPQAPSLPEPFLAAEQARQGVLHKVSQQKPSTQKPEAHWVAAVQAVPVNRGPHCPLGRPVLDAMHALVWAHAVLQHTPSTQKPDPHCVPLVQGIPFMIGEQAPFAVPVLA